MEDPGRSDHARHPGTVCARNPPGGFGMYQCGYILIHQRYVSKVILHLSAYGPGVISSM
jgi:hypothetical protein